MNADHSEPTYRAGLIDREAVVLRPDGHNDFDAIRTKAGTASASHVVFYLPELNGKDNRRLPLEDRRARLGRIVNGADAIMFSESIAAEGELVSGRRANLDARA